MLTVVIVVIITNTEELKQGMHFNFIKLMNCQHHRHALMVYWFPIATVTNYHEFGGLKPCTVLEVRNLK